MKKYYFIINPIAGKGNNLPFGAALAGMLLAKQAQVEVITLTKSGETADILRRLPLTADDTVVSIGGDGTVNEIASSLVDTDYPLAIVPRGSGNGLANTVRLPFRKKLLAKYLLEGETRRIDAGKANNNHFFCTCGFGFDAHIAALFNRGGTKRGGNRYVKQVFKELLTYEPVEADFSLDGKACTGKFFLVTFSNANQYGNNFYIAPEADITDGLLHVTIVHPFPQLLAPLMSTALAGGFINKMPYVETYTVRQAEIRSVSSSCFHCDGETLTMHYPATVEVQEKALNLVVPKGWEHTPPLRESIEKMNDTFNDIMAELEKIRKQFLPLFPNYKF